MSTGEVDAIGTAFAAAQRARGPDGCGVHHDGEVLLVHRRLSIIDPSDAGAQPLWNEDQTIAVIVNGEIYNYGALRDRLIERGHRFRGRCDSEILVHLYEESGIAGCCTAIEGMFAFALWDARTRDLYLVRDRLGIKPLVLAEHASGVTFGSTTDALLADPAVPRSVREEALTALLEWGFVPAPWSALRAARRIMPGTWVRIRGGLVVDEQRWWTDRPASGEVDDASLRETIRAAVRSHLIADVPVGCLLSAGIDSGLVTAMALQESNPGSLAVWTASQNGFPEDEFAEAAVAARHLGVTTREIPIGSTGLTESTFDRMIAGMDEPLVDTSLIALHELFAAIARDRRVVLSGDGGDELFAGYEWHAGLPRVPWWAESRGFARIAPTLARFAGRPGRRGILGDVAALVRRHPAAIYLDKLRIAQPLELRALGFEPSSTAPIHETAHAAWERFAPAGLVERMLAVDRATSLPDQMLAKMDTASMTHSVEARVPLLADAVLRAASGVPPSRKRRDGYGKVVLRDWFAEVGPPGAAWRPKTGFNSPIEAWLAGPAGKPLRDRARSGLAAMGSGSALPPTPRLLLAAAVIDGWLERLRVSTPLYSNAAMAS